MTDPGIVVGDGKNELEAMFDRKVSASSEDLEEP